MATTASISITSDITDSISFSINEQMISEGHAYVYDGGKKKVFTS